MISYSRSKSDPICKWRAVSVDNLIYIVSKLPKQTMSKQSFRDYVSNHYEGDFFHTAYQLACQMGLYYEDNEQYIPRFDHDPTKEEALEYLTKWMSRYYVPNPFTRHGFINVPPMNLVNAIIDYMEDHPNKPNLATVGAALFAGEMGNLGSVKSMLNNFATVLEVDKNNNIIIKSDTCGPIEVNVDRNDKRAFFEHFK
jgi:hypothetical protein